MTAKRPGSWILGVGQHWSTAGPFVVIGLLLAVASPQVDAQTFTLLYTFTGAPDGASPTAALIQGPDGSLYGTTQAGGDLACSNQAGCGTVFKLDSNGKETVLHAFNNGLSGRNPVEGLVRDASGNLYGTTPAGGKHGWGTVFKLNKKLTVLFAFKNGNDGGDPEADLLFDNAGNLYGTTAFGGTQGGGTVFKLTKSGKETVLHNFNFQGDGARPYAGLIRDSAGNFYGTTVNGGAGYGVVFKVGQGGEKVLYTFNDGTDGGYPFAKLVRDSQGNLYGTAKGGGANGAGDVFQVSKTGKETVVYSFTGGADGGRPYAGLVRDSKGNLYGTVITGGSFGYGAVFEIDTTGKETILHSFTGGSDGAVPYAGLLRDASGNLYGTTSSGGANSAGTIFKVTP